MLLATLCYFLHTVLVVEFGGELGDRSAVHNAAQDFLLYEHRLTENYYRRRSSHTTPWLGHGDILGVWRFYSVRCDSITSGGLLASQVRLVGKGYEKQYLKVISQVVKRRFLESPFICQ